MLHFRAGFDIDINVPFQREDKTSVVPASASYRLLHQDGTELITSTAIQDLTNDTVTVPVDSSNHVLAPNALREVRVLVLTMEDAHSGNEYEVEHYYTIESLNELSFGTNSLMTYAEALSIVPDFPFLRAWSRYDKRAQVSALIQAYHNLTRLVLRPMSLGYRSIREITAEDQLTIEPELLKDFRHAQLVEADILLGGNSVEAKRRSGLLSYSTGEVTSFYRTEKPLELPVSKEAMRFVGRHVSFSVRIGRA